MITEEDLAQQFNVIIEHTHPRVWEVIRHCYVKVITPQLKKGSLPNARYVGIYCPEQLMAAAIAEKNLLKEVAEYLGLVEVVCLRDFQLKKYTIAVVSRGAGGREQGKNQNILSRKLDNLFSGSP
ncbi:hypothetical protein Nos7524_5544 [Nostoc sp. PCC 7524]|uniref:hypothetical protein n=1 Tax=Nostoc sp. (strain ATCC 29411 / PCC 7524) TaxID=28072 RepID=UPI00029F4804|nr:hypothetical protein [Nostoc sp. PCC 7524]AFY51255.1 hypothetical protein Nos7524_5544 [Nostoc sp. PCC 7524]